MIDNIVLDLIIFRRIQNKNFEFLRLSFPKHYN